MYLFGVNRGRFEQAINQMQLDTEITDSLKHATLFVTSKSHFRRKPQKVRDAEAANLPVYVLRANSPAQVAQLLNTLYPGSEKLNAPDKADLLRDALNEARDAVDQVRQGEQETVELSPQGAYIRRLQHLIAERSGLPSQSAGHEPGRRVKIFKG